MNFLSNILVFFQICLASTWTLEDLKAAILEDISSPPISDVNLKVYAWF